MSKLGQEFFARIEAFDVIISQGIFTVHETTHDNHLQPPSLISVHLSVGAVRFGSTHAWGKNAKVNFHAKNFTAFDKLRPKFEKVGFAFQSDQTGLGSFTISTRHWRVIMQGRESLEVSQMLTQNQLPTRIHVSGTWVRAPRNPALFARGHFLARYFSAEKKHDMDSYFSEELPMKCPSPKHSACLDEYPVGGNMQYLNNVP